MKRETPCMSKSATAEPNPRGLDRRTFVKGVSAAAAGLGLALAATNSAAAEDTVAKKRRYCIVGVGVRSEMYQNAIEKEFREHAQLVGVCDTNQGRLELARARAKENGVAEPPAAYAPEQFEKMLA